MQEIALQGRRVREPESVRHQGGQRGQVLPRQWHDGPRGAGRGRWHVRQVQYEIHHVVRVPKAVGQEEVTLGRPVGAVRGERQLQAPALHLGQDALEQRFRETLTTLAAPWEGDPAVGLKRGVGHRPAVHHGKELRRRVEVRTVVAPANLVQGRGLELRQGAGRLVVNAHAGSVVAGRESANRCVHALPVPSFTKFVTTQRPGRLLVIGYVGRRSDASGPRAESGLQCADKEDGMELSRDEARALDRRAIEECGIPGAVLMENAGRNMAELLRTLGIRGTVVICCGPGNNGGDGFVMARHLDNAGIQVRVLLFARPEKLTGDTALNYRILINGGVSPEVLDPAGLDDTRLRGELARADWVVDALFGSGQRGPVRPPYDRVVEAINAGGARVFAVDIPTGLDADTGLPQGATVRAQHTATVVAPKKGFGRPEAREWLGEVHVIDIGIPRRLFTLRET